MGKAWSGGPRSLLDTEQWIVVVQHSPGLSLSAVIGRRDPLLTACKDGWGDDG